MPRKREDLTGRKFGRLTVVGYDRTSRNGDTYWLCKCDCGNPKLISVIRHSLIGERTKSCGCLASEVEDLIGCRFNRLTVIDFAGRDHEHKAHWVCRCDCGAETVVDALNLKSGHVKSCGCWNKETIGNRSRTHGHSCSNESIYPVWKQMNARCNSPNNHAYQNYGGRGISVCDEWKHDFQSFYDWAMNNGYNPGLSIDRIDNDGDYCPENCRWATRSEQSNNRRSCRYVTYAGITHTMAEWSRIFNVPYGVFRDRIDHDDMQDFEEYFSNYTQEEEEDG